MKKFFATVIAAALSLCLVACGGGTDKQPAIDAFNTANTAFTEVANTINANIDAVPEDLVDVMIEMSDALSEHKAILEGDQELTQEDVDMLVGVFNGVEAWVDETVPQLDKYLEANALALEDVADYTQTVAVRFDVIAEMVNEDPSAYDDEFVATMVELSEILTNYIVALAEGGDSLSVDDLSLILDEVATVDTWLQEIEPQLGIG